MDAFQKDDTNGLKSMYEYVTTKFHLTDDELTRFSTIVGMAIADVNTYTVNRALTDGLYGDIRCRIEIMNGQLRLEKLPSLDIQITVDEVNHRVSLNIEHIIIEEYSFWIVSDTKTVKIPFEKFLQRAEFLERLGKFLEMKFV